MRNDTVIKLLEALRREAAGQHLRGELTDVEVTQIMSDLGEVETLFAE